MSEEYSMTFYGSRVDQYETATHDMKWKKDDPRIENFCNSPYSVDIYYTIKDNGEKEFTKVEIEKKVFK